MASPASLALLRADLGFAAAETVPEPVASLMDTYLDTAAADLQRDGIVIDESVPADLSLLVMYAAWLYRRRASGEGKSEMLRQQIRDRKVAKATGSQT